MILVLHGDESSYRDSLSIHPLLSNAIVLVTDN